ncbi:unnamed protein product [Gongylonema pulchrum]|uniref:IBB domain-containing protein n=1 Tax=Gongylonema pulchrum TaxID=637853 RepID=A0A183D424_9BILA|nr:unnamed protein product [Gongylonema pulchrum]
MSSSSDEELIVRRNVSATQAVGDRRSRRSRVSRAQESKLRALEEMRRARESGGVHRVDVSLLTELHRSMLFFLILFLCVFAYM